MSAIELSKEEMELINQQRAAKAIADRDAHDRAVESHTKMVARNEGIAAEKETLANALIAADTDKMFDVSIKDINIEHDLGNYTDKSIRAFFTLGNTKHEITIEKHIVYGSRGYSRMSGSSRGYKFLLYGDVTDYKQRWYKSANSLIKAVKQLQDDRQITINRETAARSLSARALQETTAKYPDAKVTFVDGFDYRDGRNHNRNRYQPDLVKVSTNKGSYEFNFRIDTNEDKIVYGVWKRVIGSEMCGEIQKMILGK